MSGLAEASARVMSGDAATRPNVLILGASSYIGRRLWSRLQPAGAIGTYCGTPIAGGIRFDALTMTLREIVADPERISHAVILLGQTKAARCHGDPLRSRALNVERIGAMLLELKQWGITPVFTSTEAVFDGARGHYDEADPPAPIFSYGRQKAEAERLLQTTCDDYLLLRLAMVCGSEPRDGTLLVDWAEKLRTGMPIACAVDFGGSPIYVDDVVDSILALIRGGCRGIYHVAGERSYSRSELLDLLLAEAARHGCPCVSPIKRCSIDDFGLPEPRPHDISMRPAKCIAATGVRPRCMESVCRQIGDWAFSDQQQRTSTADAGGTA